MKIHVAGKKKECYFRYFHPIRVFWKELLDLGLDVKYFSNPLSEGIEECDTLLFFGKYFREIFPIDAKDPGPAAAVNYLSNYFKKFKRIVWFENQDSSGMLRTYIFPLVNIYVKNQVLRDTRYYQEEHLMGIPHMDYVHEKYHIDGTPLFQGVISDNELKKLRLGWNLSLVNWGFNNSDNLIFKHLYLKQTKNYNIQYTEPNLSQRKLHITYRANMWENVPTVNWWRKTTGEKINEFQTLHPDYHIKVNGSVNKREYHAEMRNAVVCPSPFGNGEECYRDFECFMHGSLLLKPSMDHLRTWPELYVDGETYIAHAWDFSDFNDKLEMILTHPEQYEQIAREGQNRFRKALSDGPGFAEHFKTILN